jgi:hypothetical protein
VVEALGYWQDFTDRGKGLWDALRDHYEADPGLQSCHMSVFLQQVRLRYPRLADDYESYLGTLDPDPPTTNLAELLVAQHREAVGREMAIALVEGSHDVFEALLADYRAADEVLAESDTLVGTELSDLLAVQESGNRIPIGPDKLNAAIRGGALPGHNVLLFGRPEIGKSAVALEMMVSAARAGYRTGFWENEDPLATTQIRAVQNICNASEADVRVNAGRYRPVLEQAGYFDRMFFREVIINKMVNLRTTASGDNRTLALSDIARGQRAMAKRRQCVVVGVAQAGESAINRSILRLEDLEWSNTGVQATLDLMIGIGANEQLLQHDERVLSLCKNKLGGTHDHLVVDFFKERSKVI